MYYLNTQELIISFVVVIKIKKKSRFDEGTIVSSNASV
jgi:hypothetical protein